MRSKLIATMFVVAGAMLLFAPLAGAQEAQGADKAKQAQQKADKQKADKQKADKQKADKQKAEKKKAQKKKVARADTASSASSAAMSIIDAKTTTKVEEREAVDTSDSFSTGDKVTVWISVKNPVEPGKINLVFFRNDAEAGTIELDVGKSYRWRTWGKRTVGSAGDWKVDVRDEDGTSLKTLEFTVK